MISSGRSTKSGPSDRRPTIDEYWALFLTSMAPFWFISPYASTRTGRIFSLYQSKGGTTVTETSVGMDLKTVLDRYADEIRRCRYGSFRGVIKDGKIVIFAVEHEWRPQLETPTASPQDKQ